MNNNKINPVRIPYYILIFIIGLSACRSQKKATDVVERNLETMFYASCYPVESLFVPSCRFEISYGNQPVSLSGSIYIRPDSICFFRGRLLFVEAVHGVIYRDSFIVVNYLERVCHKGKNDYLQRVTGFPVNPESLMMLFTADRCEEAYRNKFNFTTAVGNADKILMQGTNRSLIETLEEVQQIQAEGSQRRKDAEVELGRIEGELKQKLLELQTK